MDYRKCGIERCVRTARCDMSFRRRGQHVVPQIAVTVWSGIENSEGDSLEIAVLVMAIATEGVFLVHLKEARSSELRCFKIDTALEQSGSIACPCAAT